MLFAFFLEVFGEDCFVYVSFCLKEKENFQGDTFVDIQKSKGVPALGSIFAALSCLVYIPPREERLDALAAKHVCDPGETLGREARESILLSRHARRTKRKRGL